DIHGVRGYRLLAPEMVQTAVAGNPVQPRAHGDGALAGDDRLERGRKHLLKDILSVLGAPEEVAAEGKQPSLVAGHQDLERGHVTCPHESHEPLVGLQSQEPRARVQSSYPSVCVS